MAAAKGGLATLKGVCGLFMLPIRLSLKNFMSYGEPAEELDFRGFRLACISGNNGEGKSSLLDAITWALWGVARGTDARGAGADDLIRLGAEEAEIVFEFEVDADRWRVTRSRRRGRGGNLNLARKDESAWREASGATQSNTQLLINQLLGLDYQTFISSAFLLQGRADEFSRQGASDRKKILGDILGLEIFEKLAEQAREAGRAAQLNAALLEKETARLEEELFRRPEWEQKSAEAETELAAAKEKALAAREESEKKQAALSRLEEKAKQAETSETRAGKAVAKVTDLQREEEESRARLEECEKLLKQQGEIERGFSALEESRKALQGWGEKAGAFAESARRREAASLKVAQAKTKLQTQVEQLKKQQAEQKRLGEAAGIEKQLAICEGRIADLEVGQKELASLQAESRAAREKCLVLGERLKQLQAAQTKKQESLELLQGAEALCPVCRTQLSESRRGELITDTQKEQAVLAGELEQCDRDIALIAAGVAEMEARLGELAADQQHLGELAREKIQLEGLLARAEVAREQSKITGEEIAGLAERLRQGRFAEGEKEALAAVEGEISALGYDAAAHKQSTAQVEKLKPFEKQKALLAQACTLAEHHRAGLMKLRENLAGAQEEEKTAREALAALQSEIAQLGPARSAGRLAAGQLEAAEKALRGLESKAAVLKNELARLEQSQADWNKRRKEKERALEEATIYSELAKAYGKNGVQALIIETALPQLEQYANELLARLSEGGMRVSFVTQKEKGDNLAETLEIRIRDESGERRYELFSGGEAFRLNFAIRLALSRLLTQRAGAKLSTLVVDEGFGSQDAAGRQRLVEAIRAVAENFERIIVITHLEELKSEFPHRIEVSKDERGSHLRQIIV
jgi:DNA repair protein SbcC/Rad50